MFGNCCHRTFVELFRETTQNTQAVAYYNLEHFLRALIGNLGRLINRTLSLTSSTRVIFEFFSRTMKGENFYFRTNICVLQRSDVVSNKTFCKMGFVAHKSQSILYLRK